MIDYSHSIWIIAVIALMTAVTRFLPFFVFPAGKNTPKFIQYLSKVLPFALIGMLVIYCLKNISITSSPFGLPELISVVLVVFLYIWRKNTLLSVGGGTICYMMLVQFVFV